MMQTTEIQKIQSVAQDLAKKGYRVVIEPKSEDLPFSLGSYRPDIIAFAEKGGLIIEVKLTSSQVSADRFQEIAETIASHENWRFRLITLDDMSQISILNQDEDLPSWESLKSKLISIETLIQNLMIEPALLYLWGVIEVILRKRAIIQNLPIERFSMKKLLNHMYSSGEISMDELDLIQALFEKRNRIAHGLMTPVRNDDVEKLFQTTISLVNQWS
jgi:hypothetical protein